MHIKLNKTTRETKQTCKIWSIYGENNVQVEPNDGSLWLRKFIFNTLIT